MVGCRMICVLAVTSFVYQARLPASAVSARQSTAQCLVYITVAFLRCCYCWYLAVLGRINPSVIANQVASAVDNLLRRCRRQWLGPKSVRIPSRRRAAAEDKAAPPSSTVLASCTQASTKTRARCRGSGVPRTSSTFWDCRRTISVSITKVVDVVLFGVTTQDWDIHPSSSIHNRNLTNWDKLCRFFRLNKNLDIHFSEWDHINTDYWGGIFLQRYHLGAIVSLVLTD